MKGSRTRGTRPLRVGFLRSLFLSFAIAVPFVLLRVRVMDLLKACNEMKDFIGTAQKLVDAWDADPDNYSQLEEGLTALKAALQK